jgi:hypothetical protein
MVVMVVSRQRDVVQRFALVVLAKGHPAAIPLGQAVPVRSLGDAIALERG